MSVLRIVMVAPMTSKGFDFIFRPKINFENKDGLMLLDQIRTVDKTRLVKNSALSIKIHLKRSLKYLFRCLSFSSVKNLKDSLL